MTRYQRRLLLIAAYWLVFVAGVSLAWEVSLHTVAVACTAGLVGGLAFAIPEAKDFPSRVFFSRVLVTGDDGALIGRGLLLLTFVLAPGVLAIRVSYPEPVLLLLLTLGAGSLTYFSSILVAVIVHERRLGSILREAVFPGFLGLPEELRGWPVWIHTAEGEIGTTSFAGMLWEVRSVTEEPLEPGRFARLISLDGVALLVLQREEDGD